MEEDSRRTMQLGDDDAFGPLMMNVPFSVISGMSPKKTSSSLMSWIDR